MHYTKFAGVLILLMRIVLSEELKIHLNEGPVKSNLMYAGQREVLAFRNIPYAKQPIADLRFQLPQEHEGWSSEDDLSRDSRISCPQHTFDEDEEDTDSHVGQEDCLYLDIYVRKDHEAENVSLPVVVYFHGGRFIRGSKEDYGPDFLLRFSDIILVVPNYRLGILGFLSFHDSQFPGNLGLWDQSAALKWVSENIGYFGGDPKRVTIAGHEAGAVSVGLHILSTASHDYFQGALSDTGTAISPWLTDNSPSPKEAYKVAELLLCPVRSKSEILSCLSSKTLGDILKVQGKLKNTAFLPKVDSSAEVPFIPHPPKTLYQMGYQKRVNYVIGYASNEASDEVAKEFPNVLKYQHLDKMIHHFLRPYFRNDQNLDIITTAAKYHYLRAIMIPTFESIEPRIAKLMTDFLYLSPLLQVIKMHGPKSEKIFAYIFKGTENFCGSEYRRCYGNEYFVFNTTHRENLAETMQPDFQKTIETVSRIWGNFVKFGYPDSHNIWKPADDVDALQYVEISDIIKPKVKQRNEDSEFWNSLVSDLSAASNESKLLPDGALLMSEHATGNSWGAAGMAILCGVLCIALIGVVIITKRRTLHASVMPVSAPKDIRIVNS